MLRFANNPEIEALLAKYALPDEERKRLLLGNVLLGIGGGLMSGKRGNEIGAAGSGAVVGAQMGQQAVNDARANQFAGLKTRMGLQEYIDKEKARKQESDDQAEVGKIFSSGTQLQNMGPGGPTPQNAAAVAPMGQVEKYRKAAEMYAGRGKVEDAAKLNKMADDMEEQYSQTPQTVRGADGKLQLAQFGKRGGIKIADGMTPAEKLHFAGTGDRAAVGFDQYSGAQVSQGLPVAMDPAQADASKRGWAQYGLSKAADQRAAENAAKGSDGPAWVNDLERGLQIDPKSGQTRPITANGAPVGAKGITKQAEQSKTALTIIGEAEKLIDKSTGSYLGAGVDQAARVFGSSTQGAEASAQLQALEGALMLNQPRMEGPQSDKDTMIYKQMAGKIGDPTVPNPIKKAALSTIKSLHKKYSTGASVGGATGGWSIEPAN
jgi:hypothetical protein